MTLPLTILVIAIALIVLKFLVFWRLEALNIGSVRKQQKTPASGATAVMSEAEYKKSLTYTIEKSQLTIIESFVGQVLLIAVLVWGVMGIWSKYSAEPLRELGAGVWSESLFVFGFFTLYGLVMVPFSLYRTFNLEVRYGFNTMTWTLYIKDFLKSLVLSAVFMIPLLAGVFWAYEQLGASWWIWAASLMVGFQFLMQILFPRFILPLFNKLEPLQEGELRKELFGLAEATDFQTRNILVMDGSKRSKHSNAFFTGIGKSRMVVLFDTLVKQLTIPELKAVLAHEVGHYKRKHILKGLVFSVFSTFLTFFILAWAVRFPMFNEAFALSGGEISHTLLLVSLLSSTLTFYFKPVFNVLSRKHEYEADAYAKSFTGGEPLVSGLKKLYKENLSNLHPHPWYSFFYYSHPTLQEREKRLLT